MTAQPYADFLATKRRTVRASGNPTFRREWITEYFDHHLFDFQGDIVTWAVHQGRAAIWADTGLGKTRMQLAWLDLMTTAQTSSPRGLILAPLAVAEQTIREAEAIGVRIDYIGDEADRRNSRARLAITNYDRLHLIDATRYDAVVLDESSILKDVTAKTRDQLINAFRGTRYRLACTATPAPNDVTELANHAEFLGIATRREMLSTFFVADTSRGYRVKHHAEAAMWDWIAEWAFACRRPSDLGYPDDDYQLPELQIIPQLLPVNRVPDGELFAVELGGVTGRAQVRRDTLDARVARTVDLVMAEPDEPWTLWCGLNDEADKLAAAIPGAVNVDGAMPRDKKAQALLDYADGRIRVLITKPKIAGWGMNWQHSARMAFVGLGDSYEAYYQCMRRSWRYGQRRPVQVHLVLSELESQIVGNVQRKEQQARAGQDQLIARIRTRPAVAPL